MSVSVHCIALHWALVRRQTCEPIERTYWLFVVGFFSYICVIMRIMCRRVEVFHDRSDDADRCISSQRVYHRVEVNRSSNEGINIS